MVWSTTVALPLSEDGVVSEVWVVARAKAELSGTVQDDTKGISVTAAEVDTSPCSLSVEVPASKVLDELGPPSVGMSVGVAGVLSVRSIANTGVTGVVEDAWCSSMAVGVTG